MAGSPDLRAADRFDLTTWIGEHEDRPGVVAGVLANGHVQSWCSRGRDLCGGVRLTPTTVFYAASVSKQFTAACVAMCEASGDLHLDASIRTYVRELPGAFEPITVGGLLHHLGSLPRGRDDMAGAPSLTTDWWDGLGLWDLIAVLAKESELAAPPGERYFYSNAGYWLLAACVERVSGERFADFAQRRLFRPLGMLQSRFRDDPDALQPGLVIGHAAGGGSFTPISTRFHGVGDGGLLTTIEDLAKWDTFLSGRSDLGSDLSTWLTVQGIRNDGRRLYYARGIAVREHRGVKILSHGGSYIGYLSKFVRFPDQNLSIACLANADDINVDGLSMELADAVLGDLADMRAPSWADSVRDDALAVTS